MIGNNYDSKQLTLFYCKRCDRVFELKKIGNSSFITQKRKCPYCNSTEIVLLDKVFLEIRRRFYSFIQRVEKVREYIDKIILRIDQIMGIVSKKMTAFYFQRNSVVSDLIDMFTNMGLIIEHLEEDLRHFTIKLHKAIRNIINPDDRTMNLSIVNELLSEYNERVNNYAHRIKDIANKMLEVKRTVHSILELIKVLTHIDLSNDIVIIDILSIGNEIVIILDKFVCLIDPVKLDVRKIVPINGFVSIYRCRKLLSNGICIETLSGKRFFLKVDSDVADRLIQTILSIREDFIEEYVGVKDNIESKIKVLKPSTRTIRENLFQLKSQIIEGINKLKMNVHNILFVERKNGSMKNESFSSKKNKAVINALLHDLKSIYEQRLISLEDYMRLRRELYKQLFEEDEEDGGSRDEKSDDLRSLRNNSF